MMMCVQLISDISGGCQQPHLDALQADLQGETAFGDLVLRNRGSSRSLRQDECQVHGDQLNMAVFSGTL